MSTSKASSVLRVVDVSDTGIWTLALVQKGDIGALLHSPTWPISRQCSGLSRPVRGTASSRTPPSGPLRVSTFNQHDLVDSQSHSDERVQYTHWQALRTLPGSFSHPELDDSQSHSDERVHHAHRQALQTLPDYSVVSAQTERCDSQCRTRDRVRFNVFDASRCAETCLTAGSHVLTRLPRGVALCVDRKATLVPHPSSEDSARSNRHQHPR